MARINYLGQDRSQIQLDSKELSRGMAKPTKKDRIMEESRKISQGMSDIYVNHQSYQAAGNNIAVWTDTDFAGFNKKHNRRHHVA